MRIFAAVALVAALYATPVDAQAVETEVVASSNSANDTESGNATIADSSSAMVSQGQTVSTARRAAGPRYSPSSQNLFDRWMELERRKNAWIRQRLFGR